MELKNLKFAWLAVVLTGCGQGGSLVLSGNTQSLQSVLQSEAKVMVTSTVSSISNNFREVVNPNFFAGSLGNFFLADVGLTHQTYLTSNPCIAANVVSNTASLVDVIYSFTCQKLNGTYEFKMITNAMTGKSYQVTNGL